MSTTTNVDAIADKLQNLHAFYHKQWWCRLQMIDYFKWCHATFNVVTLLILALSMVVGSVWKEFCYGGINGCRDVCQRMERFQEIFTQDGHVTDRLHDLRKDII